MSMSEVELDYTIATSIDFVKLGVSPLEFSRRSAALFDKRVLGEPEDFQDLILKTLLSVGGPPPSAVALQEKFEKFWPEISKVNGVEFPVISYAPFLTSPGFSYNARSFVNEMKKTNDLDEFAMEFGVSVSEAEKIGDAGFVFINPMKIKKSHEIMSPVFEGIVPMELMPIFILAHETRHIAQFSTMGDETMRSNIKTGHKETQTNEEYFKLPHEADANSAANMVITNILKANLYQQ